MLWSFGAAHISCTLKTTWESGVKGVFVGRDARVDEVCPASLRPDLGRCGHLLVIPPPGSREGILRTGQQGRRAELMTLPPNARRKAVREDSWHSLLFPQTHVCMDTHPCMYSNTCKNNHDTTYTNQNKRLC